MSKKIIDAGDNIAECDTVPKHVIIIVAKDKKKPLTAESLYTFSKINLIRHDSLLGPMGIDLHIASIVRKEID